VRVYLFFNDPIGDGAQARDLRDGVIAKTDRVLVDRSVAVGVATITGLGQAGAHIRGGIIAVTAHGGVASRLGAIHYGAVVITVAVAIFVQIVGNAVYGVGVRDAVTVVVVTITDLIRIWVDGIVAIVAITAHPDVAGWNLTGLDKGISIAMAIAVRIGV
jgi:hypothetical protein